MVKFWHSRYNIFRLFYESFFCVVKNGDKIKRFSLKKFFALILLSLAVGNHLHLHLSPGSHWIIALTEQKVDTIVITALIGSLDVLAGWATQVYMKGKASGAA